MVTYEYAQVTYSINADKVVAYTGGDDAPLVRCSDFVAALCKMGEMGWRLVSDGQSIYTRPDGSVSSTRIVVMERVRSN